MLPSGWENRSVPAILILMFVFWVVTPYGLTGRYQCFSKILVSAYKSTYHYKIQKINTDIFIAVRTSNLSSTGI
jgi:hypothetical protein